jgi:hypothetical protein
MEMDRPPACNLKSGPDGKLKSNLEWPYPSLKLFQNYIFIFFSFKTNIQNFFALLRPLRIGFRTVVKYRQIPPAAAANQIAENARIPPAADLQKNK